MPEASGNERKMKWVLELMRQIEPMSQHRAISGVWKEDDTTKMLWWDRAEQITAG